VRCSVRTPLPSCCVTALLPSFDIITSSQSHRSLDMAVWLCALLLLLQQQQLLLLLLLPLTVQDDSKEVTVVVPALTART